MIVGVQATAARMSQETVAAQDMLTRFAHWQGREPESVAADTTYGNGEFLRWLAEREIPPYMQDSRDEYPQKEQSLLWSRAVYIYQPEHNRYICPAGQVLNYGGRNLRNRTYAYIGTRKRCGACALKAQCTSGAFRFLAIHMDDDPSGNGHGSWRRHARVREGTTAEKESRSVVRGTQESDRAAALAPAEIEVRAGAVLPGSGKAQNIKRLMRFLSQPTTPTVEATT